MAVPVEIEGKKYFATLPALSDFRKFKEFLEQEYRKSWIASLASDLPSDDLRNWLRAIQEECEAIDPFESLTKLTSTPEGLGLLFHSILRIENPNVTLDWVSDLLSRAEDGRPSAIEGIRELRQSLTALLAAKKNETMPPFALAEKDHSTSVDSTSDSQPVTD